MTSRARTTSTSDLALMLDVEQRRAAEREKAHHRGFVVQEPPAALTIARLRASQLVPVALTAACDEHDASVGAPCFRTARGVCGAWLARARAVTT
ncbi:hypothetical protein [Microbacterium sp.]|uniref:hypothetical protein n=1 Tax=Microbacterium sp. TaxID=51671 RepID=UPI003C7925AB